LCDTILQPLHLDEIVQQRELGLWGGEEPRVGLSVEAELGLLNCGEGAEEKKGENVGASVSVRMECRKWWLSHITNHLYPRRVDAKFNLYLGPFFFLGF
jgi:hypothetical protein